MALRDEYRQHTKAGGGIYRNDLGAINWSTAFEHEGRGDVLPQ